jgi:putative regulatory protein, FmdB family
MPTYEYLCEACDHRFELFQSITADPVRVCPNCGRRKVRRLIGPGAAILFKGSGFYQTDYRSDSYKKAAAADKSGSSGGNGDTSGSGKKEKEKKKAKSEV